MLKAKAPFPHTGSFALFIDDTLPPAQQRAELVRIQFRHLSSDPLGGVATIAFPLRTGAAGTKRAPIAELKDGTPLTKAEERELTDLEGRLRGRERLSPKLKQLKVRADALRHRLIFSQVMTAELTKLERLEAREQPSIGSRLPREIAA